MPHGKRFGFTKHFIHWGRVQVAAQIQPGPEQMGVSDITCVCGYGEGVRVAEREVEVLCPVATRPSVAHCLRRAYVMNPNWIRICSPFPDCRLQLPLHLAISVRASPVCLCSDDGATVATGRGAAWLALWHGQGEGGSKGAHCALKEAQLALRLCSVDAICIKLMSSSTDKQTEGEGETQGWEASPDMDSAQNFAEGQQVKWQRRKSGRRKHFKSFVKLPWKVRLATCDQLTVQNEPVQWTMILINYMYPKNTKSKLLETFPFHPKQMKQWGPSIVLRQALIAGLQ